MKDSLGFSISKASIFLYRVWIDFERHGAHVLQPWSSSVAHVTTQQERNNIALNDKDNLHLLERIHLLRPIDLDMRNIFRRERDVEELMLVVCCVRHVVVY